MVIISSLVVSILFYMIMFIRLNKENSFLFLDFGYWLLIDDIVDSHILLVYDPLSIIFSLLVLVLAVFVQFFSLEYMYRDAYLTRLLYLLQFFIFSVLFLFLVFDFFFILIAWELIGLFSLLLVNFYSTRVYTIKSAFKTFLFSRFSDFIIFTLFILLVYIFNTSDLSLFFLELPFTLFYVVYFGCFGFPLINLLSILLVLAGGIKGAQLGFNVWLPDAMEAPTPASALIHSSTLVIMGVYLLIRFGLLLELSPVSSYFLILWGSLTLMLGSISALFQTDIKKLIAYSTISQMGYLFCGCGYLCFHEVFFYLVTHALSKAMLFICAGYLVNFFLHNTDMRFMGGAKYYCIDVFFFMFFLSLNLAGAPYSAGFITKEFLIFNTFLFSYFFIITKFCWFFSFFCTPLYFTVLFVNTFGYSISSKVVFSGDLYSFIRVIPLKYSAFLLTRIERSFVFSRLSSFFYFFLFFFIFFLGETVFVFFGGCLSTKNLTEFSSILPSNFLWWNHKNSSAFWFLFLQKVFLIMTLLGFRYFFFTIRL